MTPQDHYRAAEMLLDRLGDAEDLTGHAAMLAEAQLHATLAAAGAPASIAVGPDEWLVLAFAAGSITQADAHRIVDGMPAELGGRVTIVAGADVLTVKLTEPAPSCYVCGRSDGDNLIAVETHDGAQYVHNGPCPIAVEVTR